VVIAGSLGGHCRVSRWSLQGQSVVIAGSLGGHCRVSSLFMTVRLPVERWSYISSSSETHKTVASAASLIPNRPNSKVSWTPNVHHLYSLTFVISSLHFFDLHERIHCCSIISQVRKVVRQHILGKAVQLISGLSAVHC